MIENTLQLYFCCTKLVYFKSAKLEQLILFLMHFNCVEVGGGGGGLVANFTQ